MFSLFDWFTLINSVNRFEQFITLEMVIGLWKEQKLKKLDKKNKKGKMMMAKILPSQNTNWCEEEEESFFFFFFFFTFSFNMNSKNNQIHSILLWITKVFLPYFTYINNNNIKKTYSKRFSIHFFLFFWPTKKGNF